METDENAPIRNVSIDVLSKNWHVLRRARFDFRRRDGSWHREEREAYDRGDGVALLLHDPERETILLIRQFRWPAYENEHPTGMLLEVCAGLLDGDDPDAAVRREALEETGVKIEEPRTIFTAYMSPGSVTERLHFYYAHYDGGQPTNGGGGIAEEGEDIELVELPIRQAIKMVSDGEIVDAKTIMLLQWLAIEQSNLRQ